MVHPYCNLFPPKKKFSQTKQPEMKRILNLTAISLLLLLSVLYTMIHCQEKEEEQQQQYTRDQCLSFGFVTEKLACSVCREMSTFISETSLINQCNACCNPSLDSEKVSQSLSHFSLPFILHFLIPVPSTLQKKEIQESYIRNLSIETVKLSRDEKLYSQAFSFI
jgi:hypothetical protein